MVVTALPRPVLSKPKSPLHEEMKADLALYDEEGAEGFEDPAGLWHLHLAEDSERPYFSNMQTGEVRWATPPVCAWRSRPGGGHNPGFVNVVTGQVGRNDGRMVV